MATTASSSKLPARPRVSRETVERNARKPHPPTQGPVSKEIDKLYLSEALELVKRLGEDQERRDPKLVMLQLVHDGFLMVQAFQALVRGLEAKHIEGIGKYVELQISPGEFIRVPNADGVIAKERLALLGEWVDRSTRITSLAIRAGLEQRLVDLAESQAKHMATLLQRFIQNLSRRLDLTPSQQEEAMTVMVEEVRQLETSEVLEHAAS